jgi:hypothetical protein
MVDIDNDIRKKHDLRTTDGKAAAKKEQVKRNKEQAKREKERAKREKEQAKEQAKRDAYIKWAKKNNYDPDATPTEDVLKEYEKTGPRGGQLLILVTLVILGVRGVLDIVAADFVSQLDKVDLWMGTFIFSVFLAWVIDKTFSMWSWFKLKLFIIFVLYLVGVNALAEDKKSVPEQTPSTAEDFSNQAKTLDQPTDDVPEINNLTDPGSKITDHIWIVNGSRILPSCMEVEWLSSDNYEEYQEQFPSAENFRKYPGEYFGGIVPINPINPSWGGDELLSLPKPIHDCNKLKPGYSEKTENNFISIVDSAPRSDPISYRLIAEWNPSQCSILVPNYSERCKSLVFVKMNANPRFGSSDNTYAYITDEGKDYIIPVTNGVPLEVIIQKLSGS